MGQPREILSRIKGIKNTQQITRAMKMVAAANLRKVLDRTIDLRPYSDTISRIQEHLVQQAPEVAQRHFRSVTKESALYVFLFTGDRGLCGSFNANICKEFDRFVASKPDCNFKVFCFGGKGKEHVIKRIKDEPGRFAIISHKDYQVEDIDFPLALKFAKEAKGLFDLGKTDSIYLVFSTFKNVLSQWPHTVRVWPPEIIEEPQGSTIHHHLYLYEPNADELIDPILLRSLSIHIYQAMLESVSSEYSARMTAMENATMNADDLVDDLTLEYNKSRQSAITSEILDIVGGAEAMNSSK